jgi:hypothetical protein
MAGNWARWQGCSAGNFLAWSSANSQQASTDHGTYGKGIGTGVYWYMGGPGVDPHRNGGTAEARAWGARQAAAALASVAHEHVTYPVLFMDNEMPGIKPAPDIGWNDVYSDAGIWAQVFGTGGAAHIPHTYEWTYEPETANLGDAPDGWCLKDGQGCAQFFGGVTRDSGYAVMWQWSGGGECVTPSATSTRSVPAPISAEVKAPTEEKVPQKAPKVP